MPLKILARKKSFFEDACLHLVGGVNSPVRAFRAVGGEPFFVARARGPKIHDRRGQKYLDYVMSWGSLILGHAHPAIVSAVRKAAGDGTSFGAPTGREVELAHLVKEAFPSIEKVRLVSSGTEAVMTAVRLARGFTGRKRIVKFSGCYHGHSDSLLVKAGSGAATLGIPASSGVPPELARLTINLPYNDPASVEKLFRKQGDSMACILVEPVAGNMGLVLPEDGFLGQLRETADRYGTVLIFDEVITGFRVAWGGAQELYQVRADLTCLGKILGGGLPMGAVGGSAKIMNHLAPEGDVYQAGTLSGNPLATASGMAALRLLRGRRVYRELEEKGEGLAQAIGALIREKEYPLRLNHLGSLFTLFFTPKRVSDYESARTSDTSRYARFFHGLLEKGIFFPPSQFETCFLSLAHGENDLQHTVGVIRRVLKKVFQGAAS